VLATEFEVNGSSHAEVTDDLVAQHYSYGGAPAEAIKWWHKAAKQAITRSAHEEAANILSRAFQELKILGAAPPSLELELTLLMTIALQHRGVGKFIRPPLPGWWQNN
jgi:hypothetical protein